MKLKRFFLAVVCIIIGLLPMCTAACGSNERGKRGIANVVDDLKFDENGDPIFGGIKLKVWSIVGQPDAAYLAITERMFNEYYKTSNLSAEITPIANATFYSQLANTLNTDPENAPDVVIFHSERLPMLVSNNILMPMESFYQVLGENNTFSADNYIKTVMDECYYGGRMYGVPLDVHSGVWYCRQDILEKNGLSVPHTLSEFVSVNNELVKKAKDGNLYVRGLENQSWQKKPAGTDYRPVVMSASGGMETGWIPQTVVLQNGGQLADANGKPAWKTQSLEKAMSMFRDWQNGTGNFNGEAYKGAFIHPQSSYETVWSNLASGESVFSFEGTWWTESRLDEYESALGNKTLGDSAGKTYKPLTIISPSKMFAFNENAEYASKVYGVGHCVSVTSTVTSKTKCVAAALFAQYITENSEDYTRGGHLPASKSVFGSEKLTSMPHYSRYLNKMGNPDDFVMLGGTQYYQAVYECLKGVYSSVLAAANKGATVAQLINAQYNQAMQMISAGEDL